MCSETVLGSFWAWKGDLTGFDWGRAFIMSSTFFFSADETAKVSHHLSLLRQEYNKLQVKHAQLQHQFDVGQAVNGRGKGTFLLKLLRFVAELHHSPRLRFVIL